MQIPPTMHVALVKFQRLLLSVKISEVGDMVIAAGPQLLVMIAFWSSISQLILKSKAEYLNCVNLINEPYTLQGKKMPHVDEKFCYSM